MFKNREEAGELLFLKLQKAIKLKNILVVAIPRGGVVLGKVIANRFVAPFDVLVIKKIGAPTNPELAIGAVGPKNVIYWDRQLCSQLNIGKTQIHQLANKKLQEREEKEKILREGRLPINVKDKNIILVDDGVATGATVLAAAKFLRREKAKSIILAVPVIAKNTFKNINRYFDNVIALSVEEDFYAVGQFYQEFPQVEDEEVIEILNIK